MEIKSKFEENNAIELLTRPFVAMHKPSGNVFLFQKTQNNNENIAIVIAADKMNGLTVGHETETTFSKYPNDWRIVLNPTITVTEG